MVFCNHAAEFQEYRESSSWPLKVLYDSQKRKRLAKSLCHSVQEQQLNLFREENADSLLQEIAELI